MHAGDHDQHLEHVLQLWSTDTAAGLDNLMIAADHATVTDLNHRARAHLIATGAVTADGVRISDAAAGMGDRIITRHNDRALRYGGAGRAWVRNGDTRTVTVTHPDGSLTARDHAGSDIHLDARYVIEHVELGYATTANLAQGRTLDTAHAVVSSGTTREGTRVARAAPIDSNGRPCVSDTTARNQPDCRGTAGSATWRNDA